MLSLEGHGLPIMKFEMCGVCVKEDGRRPVYRIMQCLKFAQGSCRELRGVSMSERQRGKWWFLGRLFLPKAEVCPRLGHRGFTWVTCDNVGEWEIELYERNVELIETEETGWYPVDGITSGRPQIWHPMRLKGREISISGNPQSFVVYHRGEKRDGKWLLIPLGVEEVVSYPEERLGWERTSLTSLSRSCVRRVTAKVREMMGMGSNQRRVQGTVEGYSRREWGMYLDMTVDDHAIAGLKWKGRDAKRSQFLDGGLNWCGLMGATEEQKVRYQTGGELRLLERADSDYSLSTLPRALTIGNSRVFHVERGHSIRQCTRLEVVFVCGSKESVGQLKLTATYQEAMYSKEEVGQLLRGPPPPPSSPPPLHLHPQPPIRPPPEERELRCTDRREQAVSERERKRFEEGQQLKDVGEDLLGKTFWDEELGMCEVRKCGEYEGKSILWYTDGKGEDNFSSVSEVREWCD